MVELIAAAAAAPLAGLDRDCDGLEEWSGKERMAAGRSRGHWVVLASLVALAACTPEPAPEPVTPPTVSREQPLPPVTAPLDDELCTGLFAAVAAWPQGFQELRAAPLAPYRWEAPPLDQGLDRCVVDGAGGLAASYVCTPRTMQHGDPGTAGRRFDIVQAQIDRCLARPAWYPRRWAKAAPVQLAAGERQQLWRDQAAWPRPALQLKLEEDYDRPGAWTIRFTAYTMR